jgi:phage antirepressor YoqD-like protein
MKNLMTIENVKGFLDPKTGTAYLNAEDVARGFGFTQDKNGIEYVRWETVNGYLTKFGFSQRVGKDDYLPENMVYRLGFKANNETAKKFQAKLADDVIPAIRKTGMYMTENAVQNILNNPTAFIEILTEYKKVQDENKALAMQNASQKQLIGELKPKADYTDLILKSKSLVTITQIAKDYGMSGQAMNKILHNLGIIYNQSGQWLLYSKHQAKGYTHSETVNIVHSDGRENVKMNTKWTQKGRLFLYNTLKKEDIIPVIEKGA